MNILIIAAGYPPDVIGGGEFSTKIITEELINLGHKISVLTISDEPSNESINGVEVYRNISPNVYWSFKPSESKLKQLQWHFLDNINYKSFNLVQSYLRKIKPDIVITSTLENFGASAWDACYKNNIPVVHILRSYYLLCYKSTCFKDNKNCVSSCSKCKFFTFNRRYSAKKINGLIGISDFMLKKHENLFPNALKRVIYNPVDFKAIEKNKLSINSTVFGYLGRLEAEKGIEVLLDAFISCSSNNVLFLAGNGNEQFVNHLKNKYNQPNIYFLGWINANDLFKQINYLIMPALWHEPFGRVVVEAFSCSIPVIGSYRGGISELIEHGENGYLFNPEDNNELKKIIQKVENNITLHSRLSKNAYLSSQQFKKRNIAIQYETFMQDVLTHNVSNAINSK